MKKYSFFKFLVLLLLATPALAGEYGMQSVNSWTDWETDCDKPSRPYFSVYDRDSYNLAVDEYNNYVHQMKNFLSCVEAEAEDDIKAMANSISEGSVNAQDEAISDVESLKRELENQKYMIQ